MKVTHLLVGSIVFGVVVLGGGLNRPHSAWGQAATGLVINEFMATNGAVAPLGEGEILDADGDSSDWIEIRNPSDETVDIGGWYLTDDADDLTQWRFPDGTSVSGGGFVIVFASGKNRTGNELHANFKLSADGEYLALVAGDGVTVVHEYEPCYPEQLTGISYGLGRHGGVFVSPGALASYHLPRAADADASWTPVGFDDADWSTAATGLGFTPVEALSSGDIGDPQVPGSFFVSDGTYVVQGAGEDIGGTRDSFYFVYAPLRGDGEVTVNVAGMITANDWSKAGVMIRETLTTGSPYAAEMLTLGHGVFFQARTAANGASLSTEGNEGQVPTQVRIIRRGDTFSGYYCLDGVNWIQQSSETIDMGPDAYIGLCVTSRIPASPCTAVFEGLMFGSQENNALRERMLGTSAALWMRMAFDADETDFFDSLELAMQYEDGFVAFLNGVEVARDNFTGALQWTSVADGDRPDGGRAEPVLFDLSAQKDLLRDGRNVLAIAALNDDVDDETFFVSAGLTASGDVIVPQYFVTPTPGQANSAGPLEIVAMPVPSHPHGLYNDSFVLEFSSDTPAATIRYTTDGTDPTQTSGSTYAGPIHIDATTCLRVAAFRPGWMASEIRTHTYILLDQVLEQPKNPAGMPTRWGSTTADYEMDPDIVNHATYGPYLKAGLMTLPTMSLVVRADDLFGSNGIYTNWNSSGDAWERPASVEMIYPDGSEGFHVNCGIRIYGGVGRREPKKSFRLQFTRDYGPTKLHYALFGDEATDRFDQILLRANFNDAYTWGGDRSQYIRDEYVRRLQLAMGDPSPHGVFVHLYINGVYWGLYNPTERPEASFSASYFGGDKEDWDALNSGRPLGDSSTTTWNAMLSLVRQGVETNEAYQRLQGNDPDGTRNPNYVDYLDIDNYINYMLLNIFVGNRDWPGHNWYAAMNRVDSSGWKCYSWDAEWVIGMNSGVTENRTSVNNSLCEPYARLRNNTEFCMAFADRAQQAFFNDGLLYVDSAHPNWDPTHPERNRPAALYAELADGIELAMLGESARWGDVRGGSPYTLAQWQNQRDWVLGTYMPQRSAVVLDQLRDAGLYPNVDAPAFGVGAGAQHGGHVALGERVWMYAADGTVYYTTDGSDPRLPSWNSADTELVTLLTEDAPKRVLVPSVANGGDQLGNIPPSFTVTYYKATGSVDSVDAAEQVIANPLLRAGTATEQASVINYFNTGSPGNFDDDRPFPGTQLNADVEDFVILATGTVVIPTAGEWTFGVNSDDGFGLTLTNGRTTYSMSYPDPRGPADTLQAFNLTEAGPYELRLVFYERGGGSELELFATRGRYISFSASRFRLVGDIGSGGLQVGQGDVWFANTFDDSTWTAGTGGVGYEGGTGSYPAYFDIDVAAQMHDQNASCYIRIPFEASNAEYSNMILRVRYDDGFVAYLNGAEIARRNFTGELAWNSNASTSNSDDAAVSLASIDISGHVGMLWEGTNVLAIHGLNLSVGSSDFLISAELVAGEISQGAVAPTAIAYTEPFVLAGSTHIKARTLNGQWSALNKATFAVGPVAESLRISEMMYHPLDAGSPDDPNTEYVELTNIGAETINLNLVAFTNGIDFVFPSTELAPAEYLLVVRDIEAFEARYGPGLPIAGQYGGSLNNGGERIELQDATGRTIHKFDYSDNWYDLTDGLGFSLTVKAPAAVGEPNALDEKSAWRPSVEAEGSPGFDDGGDATDPGAIVINEIMADAGPGEPDWIELHNTTDQPIDIGGWFLSDDGDDLTRYEIAAGTSIAAGDYLVFFEDLHFGNENDPGCHAPFALSRKGETVYLHSGADGVLTGYSEQEKFDTSETGVSQGRYLKSTAAYNFVSLAEPTPGAANAEAKVGPVVIGEIMYNPFSVADAEYVELFNISDEAVTLYDAAAGTPWRFTDDPDDPGIELLFPTDPPVVLAPGECLIVTKDLAIFESAYVVPEGVQVFAWGVGKLANSSEKIQLSIPGGQDDGQRTWIRVDRVVYSDGLHPEDFASGVDPWPLAADGYGGALTRIDPAAYGNDPANWQAAVPSPGFIN